MYVLIAFGGLLITYLLIRKFGKNTAAFANSATIALTVIICIYANFFIATGKSYGYNARWYKDVAIDGAAQLKLDTSTFYRVDVLDGMDNQAMFWGIPTIQAFQSTVSNSILTFIRQSAWHAMWPRGLRSIWQDFGRSCLSNICLMPISTKLPIPGWVYDSTQLGFKGWRNTNFIPMGYTFNYYITDTDYLLCDSRDRLLPRALVLNSTQIKKYSNILQQLPESLSQNFSDQSLAADCANRAASSCSTFKTDNTGFSATISLTKENLVFFSVPYDSGWSATVNGKPATIAKVDIGFMAVECPAGFDSIRFNYMTPGLKTGGEITAVSIAALALYLVLYNVLRKKRKSKNITLQKETALPANYDNHPDGDEN